MWGYMSCFTLQFKFKTLLMKRYSVSKHDVKVISWIFLPGSGRTTGNKTEKAARQFQTLSLPNCSKSCCPRCERCKVPTCSKQKREQRYSCRAERKLWIVIENRSGGWKLSLGGLQCFHFDYNVSWSVSFNQFWFLCQYFLRSLPYNINQYHTRLFCKILLKDIYKFSKYLQPL